jgi:hypothetical protein
MTKVRWLIDLKGTVSLLDPDGSVNNDRNGVRRGQITYLDDATAEKYARVGYITTRHLEGELPPPFQIGTMLPPHVRDERFAAKKKNG